MRYPWIAITIILLWMMATFTILSRDEVNPELILGGALAASALLGVWGFRIPQ